MQNKNEKIVYQGRIVELVQYPVLVDGKEVVFEKARRSPGVRLLIETPDGQFILNREKRHELGLEEDLRLPGGKVFDSLLEYNTFLSNQKDETDIIEKAKEAAEKEARDIASWDDCGSFDPELYCTDTKRSFLYKQKINNFLK